MLKIHYVKKIFIGLIAFSLISGSLLINNVYAGKGVKYKEGIVSGGATIEGKVFFKGTPPAHQVIAKDKDSEVCGTGTQVIDPWTLGSNGELLNAVVYIQDIKTGKKWLDTNFHFDQKACGFVPFISVMRNKGKLKVTNLDPIGHNVHAYEYVGKVKLSKLQPGGINMTVINIAQPNQGLTFKKKIKLRRDNQMKLECDIHNFMHGWVLALENPYYSMTKADGSFKIDNVPAGTYKVIAWHPTFGTQEQSVLVKDGTYKMKDFKFN